MKQTGIILQNDDPDANDLNVDYSLFEEVIWPLLAHRIPAFEAIKVMLIQCCLLGTGVHGNAPMHALSVVCGTN